MSVIRQTKYKQYDITGCKIIGIGAKGSIYRYNDELIVKVFRETESLSDIEEEVRVSRTAFVAGIPTAISFGIGKVGERYAAVYELLDSNSLLEELSNHNEDYIKYAGMLSDIAKTIHSIDGTDKGFLNGLDIVNTWIDTGLSYADKEVEKKVRSLILDLPKVSTLIHGDLHAGNIMCTKREPLLIDMGTMSVGHPIIELANLYMFYVGLGEITPGVIENYMHIPYSVSKKYYRSVLSGYLKTDDQKRIDEVTDKAAILAYTRLLRWAYKKGVDLSKEDTIKKDHYLLRLHELTERVTDLNF